MSKVYTSIDQLIGHTPLLELTHFEADEDLKARVLVKLEYFNPAGSVKDRVAKNMIDEAEKAGKLVRGGDYTIIEPTSGNTGVGIASVAAARGYKVIITMPETMSVERRKLMQAYGAQLVLTDGSKGMKGRHSAKAEELPMIFYMFTDVKSQSTDLMIYGNGAEDVVAQAFDVTPKDGMALLKGVVSRKKQIIPPIMATLQKIDEDD